MLLLAPPMGALMVVAVPSIPKRQKDKKTKSKTHKKPKRQKDKKIKIPKYKYKKSQKDQI